MTKYLQNHDQEVITTGPINKLSEIIDWGVIDIEVPKLWQKNKGDNISIMVCDTGISDHEDLKNNIDYSKTISCIPGEDYVDYTGHGTAVAGVIAAQDSGFGVVGVAPNAKIISVKVFSRGGGTKNSYLIQALEYAIQVRPDILNLSFGIPQRLGEKFHSLIKEINNLNIPIVCAMGNSGDKFSCFPADYPETLGVTSYRKDKQISNFSSRSVNADFALPGENILTTTLNNQYSIVNGTSFASPFLAGLIAIILAEAKKKNINYTVDEIKNLLIKNSTDYGDAGKDNKYGYGILNIPSLLNQI